MPFEINRLKVKIFSLIVRSVFSLYLFKIIFPDQILHKDPVLLICRVVPFVNIEVMKSKSDSMATFIHVVLPTVLPKGSKLQQA